MDLTELTSWQELNMESMTDNQRKMASFLRSKFDFLIVGNYLSEIKEMARLFGYSVICVPLLSRDNIRGTEDYIGNSWIDSIEKNPEEEFLVIFLLDDADAKLVDRLASTIKTHNSFENLLCGCIFVDKDKYVKTYIEEYTYFMKLEEDEWDLGYQKEEIQPIDLGLPSGLLWADRNLGTDNQYPNMLGCYWAWGQTKQKQSSSRKDNYHFFDDKNFLKKKGAKYQLSKYEDAAYCSLGSNWRIPTHDDYKELMEYCKVAPATRDGIKGVEMVGPNGNSIFIPYSGGFECEMWCSRFSCYDDEEEAFYAESFGYPGCEEDGEFLNLLESTCYDGLQIRPVFGTKKVEGGESENNNSDFNTLETAQAEQKRLAAKQEEERLAKEEAEENARKAKLESNAIAAKKIAADAEAVHTKADYQRTYEEVKSKIKEQKEGLAKKAKRIKHKKIVLPLLLILSVPIAYMIYSYIWQILAIVATFIGILIVICIDKKIGKIIVGVGTILLVVYLWGHDAKSEDMNVDSSTPKEVVDQAISSGEVSTSEGNVVAELSDDAIKKNFESYYQTISSWGSPTEYVSSCGQITKDNCESYIDAAYEKYENIKDAAYDKYEKIKDQMYSTYEKIKETEYAKYEKIKDETYKKYQAQSIEYSEYSNIQSSAYDAYSTARSEAYDEYSTVQSTAYDEYNEIQSKAYDWYSEVKSLLYDKAYDY